MPKLCLATCLFSVLSLHQGSAPPFTPLFSIPPLPREAGQGFVRHFFQSKGIEYRLIVPLSGSELHDAICYF
jgi:hypothetical protein